MIIMVSRIITTYLFYHILHIIYINKLHKTELTDKEVSFLLIYTNQVAMLLSKCRCFHYINQNLVIIIILSEE